MSDNQYLKIIKGKIMRYFTEPGQSGSRVVTPQLSLTSNMKCPVSLALSTCFFEDLSWDFRALKGSRRVGAKGPAPVWCKWVEPTTGCEPHLRISSTCCSRTPRTPSPSNWASSKLKGQENKISSFHLCFSRLEFNFTNDFTFKHRTGRPFNKFQWFPQIRMRGELLCFVRNCEQEMRSGTLRNASPDSRFRRTDQEGRGGWQEAVRLFSVPQFRIHIFGLN